MPRDREFDSRQPYAIIRRELISGGWYWPTWLPAVARLGALARKKKFAALLVGQILPYGTVALIVRQRMGVPYWVVVHGMDVARLGGRKRLLARLILARAEGVIANSFATADLVSGYGISAAKIFVLTPGVSEPRISMATARHLREQFGLAGKRVLLTVGRLVRRKGHGNIIRVLPKLARAVPNLRYAMVGDGPERQRLERLVRARGVSQAVIFTGEISGETLAAWYEASDVFALTPDDNRAGDMEGFGMVYLEANSFGKPVVATRVGGVGEAVVHEHTGLLVPPNDADALYEALARLLTDHAYAHTLGLQGQDRALTHFRWEDRGTQLADILGE